MRLSIEKCEQIITETQNLLFENQEWVHRYIDYGKAIFDNIERIKDKKRLFNQWAPLYIYMNVLGAKGTMPFSLRYLGQDIATLKVNKNDIIITTKNFAEKNMKYFGCDIDLDGIDWTSKEAAKFRKYFKSNPKRINAAGKNNEEHRIESLLLTEFSKKNSKEKLICNIQPVKIAGISRFQMPTPIAASKVESLKYSGYSGGGIDILARIGTGGGVELSIMEVKDKNTSSEPPEKVILQGLSYATFIRELLRSDGGEDWWKIFGFKRRLPDKINFFVTCVMPSIENDDTTFSNFKIKINQDTFHLNYMYYIEKNNHITDFSTSLKQCIVKKA